MIDESSQNSQPLDFQGPVLKKPSSLVLALSGIFVAILTLVAVFIFGNGTFINNSIPALKTITDAKGQCQTKTGEDLTACCTNWMKNEGIVIPACEGKWEALETGCGWNCAVE